MKKLLLIALVVIADFLLFTGLAHATPMAWGQPMPERCTTTFVWASPATYPIHVYADPTCAKPWAENAVAFWNWFREKANGSSK
jgi:hypothetical protein